jgi:hypothetical protein
MDGCAPEYGLPVDHRYAGGTAMKMYEITQVVEMMITHKVRAANADEANRIATERTQASCAALSRTRSSIHFGDIAEDYIPARDD